MAPFLRVWLRRLIPPTLVVLLAGLMWMNLRYVELAPARSAFVARWEGGRAYVRQGLSPYDPQVSELAQERVFGRPANLRRGEDPQHFLYPFPSLLLFAPLGLLSYPTAQALWMTLTEIALLGASLGWIGALNWKPSTWVRACLVVFGFAWFPGFVTLVDGQTSGLVWLFLVGGIAAAQARREAIAGWLLALSLIKPQLGIGLAIYVGLWSWSSGRRLLVGWLALGVASLFGLSFLIEPDWLLGLARQAFDYFGTSAAPSALARLSDLLDTGVIGTVVMTAVAVSYLAFEWRDSLRDDRRRFLWTAAMTQTVALLVLPFSSLPNLVTLGLPIVAILEAWYSRQGRAIDAPATVILLLVGAASWTIGLPALEGAPASPWALVGMPLACLLGLLWVRWWSIRGRVWSELGSQGT